MGLCNRVVEPDRLLPEAKRTAATIATRAPLAIANAKRALREAVERAPSDALVLEADLFAELFATADLANGMRAFLNKEKQNPKWQAR